MQFMTAALGVECGFCHVENHFDQNDKKPKQTARKMMQMVMAINQSHFEGHRKITCNTCHRADSSMLAVPKAKGFGLTTYAVPIAAFVVAAALVALAAVRWRRRRPRRAASPPQTEPLPPIDPNASARLEADLKRYDL